MSSTGRWQELFGGGRKWRVAEEVSGTDEHDGATTEFFRGRFEIHPSGFAYASPVSTNFGVRGMLLQETDASGEHDIPGSRLAIGATAVAKAREQFQAVW